MLTFGFGKTNMGVIISNSNLQYPTFSGSQPTLEGLTSYIQRQAQYPEAAMEMHQQGRVYVSFEVSEEGEVEHTDYRLSSGLARRQSATRAQSATQSYYPTPTYHGRTDRTRFVHAARFLCNTL